MNYSEGEVQARIGEKARDFVLRTYQDDEWRLSDHLGSVVVLLFYPQNETMVCNRQLCSVRDNWSAYVETNAIIVGVSPGTSDEHLGFIRRHRLPMPLLCDPDRRVTRMFGKHRLYPISFTRSIVVVDAKGIVRSRDIMLRAFRPTDERVIANIYQAKGDAFSEKYDQLKKRLSGIKKVS